MSIQTICNRCRKEIKTDISINPTSQVDETPYYELTLRKYSCGGKLMDETEYHLCENCGSLYNEFIDVGLDKSTNDELHDDADNRRQYNSYVLGDHVMPIENTIQIGNMLKPIKSVMVIGNLHIHNTKKFNKLEKFMWKKFFGFEIKEIDNNEKNN